MSHEEVKIVVIVNQRGGKCGADSCRRLHKKETGDRRQICRKGKSASRQETDAVGMATGSGSGQAKRQEVTRSARRLAGVGGRKGDRKD